MTNPASNAGGKYRGPDAKRAVEGALTAAEWCPTGAPRKIMKDLMARCGIALCPVLAGLWRLLWFALGFALA